MPNNKVMHVAEKPSVAKEIAKVIAQIAGGGHPQRRNGHSPYNHIWEFNYQGKQHQFTSVAGHLLESEFAIQARSWRGFPLSELFHVPIEYNVKGTNQGIKRTLEDLARSSNEIVLWLDCDREGESICFEVLKVVQGVKPRIVVKRARFSALTQRDIQRALNSLVQPDQRAADAVQVRQELDFRIGAAFTRFQTLLFQEYIEAVCATPEADDQVERMRNAQAQHQGAFAHARNNNNNNDNEERRRPPYSFGPCQFPCLGFVVSKYWERESFQAEKFWNCQFDYEGAKFTWTRGNIFDRDIVAVLVENMIQEALQAQQENNQNNNNNQLSAKIASVNQKPNRKFAPAPLATVELQKLVSQYLRIPSERCMDVAEKLYQEGFISYPRTETDSYSFTDDELKQLAAAHDTDAAQWKNFAHDIVSGDKYRRPRNGGHDDKAHPPIHPLKFGDPRTTQNNQLNDQRSAIYELICRHFLSSMMPEAEAGETTATAFVAREEFKATGFAVVSRGWLECFRYDNTWRNNRNLPNFQVDQVIFPLNNFIVHEGTTTAPPLLSEAQLISEMDNFGIGTDATIASHINTVQQRGYVVSEDNGQRMRPTELGIALASAYDAISMGELWKPQLRAQTELAMLDVAQGRANKQQVMDAFIQYYKERFTKVQQNVRKLIETLQRTLPPKENNNNNNRHQQQLMRGGFRPDDDDDDQDNNNGGGGGDDGGAGNNAFTATGRTIRFLQGDAAAALDDQNSNSGLGINGNANQTNNSEVILDECPACQRNSLCLNFRQFTDKETKKEKKFWCLSCSGKCGATVYFNRLADPVNFPRLPPQNPQNPQQQRGVIKCRCGAKKMEFGLTTSGGPVMYAEPDELMCFKCDSRLKDENHVKMMRCEPQKQQQGQQQQAVSMNNNFNNPINTAGNQNATTSYQLPQLASERQTSRQAGAEKKQRERQIANQIDPSSNKEGSKCATCDRTISIRTSQSQKNPGKKFYSCGTRTCGFMGWVD